MSEFPRVPNPVANAYRPTTSELARQAFEYRKKEGMLTPAKLSVYNVAVFKIVNGGRIDYITRRNRTIAELNAQHGAASDPPLGIGFHSEMLAADEFKLNPKYKDWTVVEIFTERTPCQDICKSSMAREFSGVPIYAYITRNSKLDAQGNAEALMMAYGVWAEYKASRAKVTGPGQR